MTTQEIITPPPVMWAQRHGIVFVTINLEDCKDPLVKVEKDSVYFKGVGGSDQKLHEVKINLFKEINPDASKTFCRDRNIELILVKTSSDEKYWPTLTSDKIKHHWLKCDFNKWIDEDESGDEAGAGGGDFEEMMRQMGGLAAAEDKPSLDDLDGENDSDDEDIPDLE